MKKLVFFLFAVCLISAPYAGAAGAPITLRFANQNSDTSWSGIHAIAPWAKQVEQATHGRVKIQIYYNQTLCKGKDTWEAVKNGIADIGWCFHGYWPGLTPLADVISLPALPFKRAEKGSAVLWKLYEKFPQIRKEFSANKVLLLFTSTPYVLMTRNKEVKTMQDLKGLKIRMTGGPPTDMMRALGAVPVLIPMPDLYISMQKGVIDGSGVPWEAVHGFRLYEVGKYFTEAPLPAVYFSISMNKDKWNSLPKDIQNEIMSVSGLKGSEFWGYNHFDTAKAGVMAKAKAEHVHLNIYALPAKERARWVEVAGKPIWKEWVKKMEAQGHPEAQKILDTTLELLKQSK